MKPNEIAYFYEKGTLGGFSTSLMNLICKADPINKARIQIAFPEYIEAYELWFNKPEGWDKWES